jgi:two-component system, LytTR family, sensor kinase
MKLPTLSTIHFLPLQNSGWLAFFLIHWLSAVAYGKGFNYGWLSLCIAINGWLVTAVLHKVFNRLWQRERKLRLAYIVPCLIIAVLWMCLVNGIAAPRICTECTFNGLPGYLAYTSYIGYVLLSWTALWFGIKTMRAFEEEKHRAAQALVQANAAQLKMLRYQLNPHFLFNTLNAISTLTLARDFEQSEQMLSGLARFLRYTLEMEAQQHVPLAREIEMLRLYLDIEATRFSDRLSVRFDIAPELNSILIPSMLLQPLVENSIKHAVTQSEQTCLIHLTAERVIETNTQKPRLRLLLSNDCVAPMKDHRPGVGVGLRNTAERLQTLYGDQHQLRAGLISPNRFEVQIEIPIEVSVEMAAETA